MQKSFQEMATRLGNAEVRFAETVIALGFTADEAVTIAKVYVHVGVLAFDAVDGQFYIRHGALMEVEPMRNALANSEAALKGRKVNWKRR